MGLWLTDMEVNDFQNFNEVFVAKELSEYSMKTFVVLELELLENQNILGPLQELKS